MKTLSIYAAILFSIFSNFSYAQTTTALQTDTIKVWGNCDMCKTTIEKAAKSAGAATADWNEETHILNVSYNSAKTTSAKIQTAIAAKGYDTQDFTGSLKAYNKLPGCCKYDRKTSSSATSMNCCTMENCGKKANCCAGMTCCSSGTQCKKS